MSDETSKKLAVLIDADNAQASLCNELFSEVSKYGLANVKRAYGDWTTTNLKGWKELFTNMQFNLYNNLAILLAKTLLIHH